jgi:hypothetical protein
MFTNAEDIIKDFEKCGKLNPFKLKQKPTVDMFDALNKYKVVSSCPSDDVFFTPRKRRESSVTTKKSVSKKESAKDTEESSLNEPSVSKEPPKELDGVALKIYKKIPVSGECLIESLVDSEISLRDILRAMPKLEMHRLVELLPGEKIKRKSK